MKLYGDALVNAPLMQTGRSHAKREAASTYLYLFTFSPRGGGGGGGGGGGQDHLGINVPRPNCEEMPYVLGAPLLRDGKEDFGEEETLGVARGKGGGSWQRIVIEEIHAVF